MCNKSREELIKEIETRKGLLLNGTTLEDMTLSELDILLHAIEKGELFAEEVCKNKDKNYEELDN